MNVVMDFGETRHVRMEICNILGQDFTILKCDYELVNPSGDVEVSGAADIINHILDVVIMPLCVGDYDLKYTYYIADEILIEHVRVTVLQKC